MLHLIVHGDDFGLSEKVNEGILKAHIKGILTSTSLIANGAAFEHAISICKSTPSLDVGVHLALVEETPLVSVDLARSMVSENGRFHYHATDFIKRYLSGKICLREMKRELEAQIRRVVAHGVNVSHIDSHQHLHMLPKILHITVELAKKYHIPAIRFPREIINFDTMRGWRSITRIIQMMVLRLLCKKGRNTDLIRTDHFLGFLFGGNLDTRNLKRLLVSLSPHGTFELMCHPGLDDPYTRYAHWGYHWSDELNALIDPEIAQFIETKGIKLISYRQLAKTFIQ